MYKSSIFSLHRWFWLVMGSSILLLRIAVARQPLLVEHYYSQGIYPCIRLIMDHSIGLIPFPLIYLVFALLIGWLIASIRTSVKTRARLPQKVFFVLQVCLNWVAFIIFFFLLLWGFNYARQPLEDQLGVDPQPLSINELREELLIETERLISLREAIPYATIHPLGESGLAGITSTSIIDLVDKALAEFNLYSAGKPTLRLLQPKGILLRISTAGFYLPLTGECNLDAGLHPLQLPFVMAHELFHAHGITDEGSCNFLAYLSCELSADPFVRYAGSLNYWRYLAGSYRQMEPLKYTSFRADLPAGLVADLDAINKRMQEYPDIFPDFRDLAYNTYLKAQGIPEGMKNYSRIIMLVRAWRIKKALEKNSSNG